MQAPTREYQRISLEVSKLLSKCRVTKAPVMVKDIAKETGLEVVSYNLGSNVSGVLIINGSLGSIGYNPLDPEVRQRFTIAHELGHYILHRKPKGEQLFVDKTFLIKFRSSNQYNQEELDQERQANTFAAELLMPEHLIQAELAKEDYNDLTEVELIEKLAKVFNVSSVAMTYRLSNINLP